MAGDLVDLSRQPVPTDMMADVVVVGSGCGGGTAARVLAEAGHDVVVLEEGGDFTGRALTQRDGQMYDQLYMDRGGRATDDMAISVLQGRVLGGGGVINASDVVPMSDEVLAFWRSRFGLTHLTSRALEPHRAAALADLQANPIAEAQLNANNRLLRDGSRRLGMAGEVMQHNREGCSGLGTCLIGCPIGAKRNPRAVAIPAAMQADARFFTRARAVRIDSASAELKTIAVRTLDERGYHERGSFLLRARTVILAANAVNSAQLLLRSGVGNEHVGRHLSLQPQLPVVARFPQKLNSFRGIPQAYAVTHGEEVSEERGLWGYRIESIMATPGVVSTLLPFVGAELKDAMTAYPHYAAALLLVPDEPSGRITLTADGRPRISYQHLENHKARTRDALKAAARAFLAAGATQVEVPLARPLTLGSTVDLNKVDGLDFAPCTAPWLSAHQQGGVRMAPASRDGATDPDGQVWGTRGVYVFDSSWFPSSSSSHTMTPIIMMARYLAHSLVARLRHS